MTNVNVKKGNLFTSQCQTLVNTINCDGVMGAGIALEFKLRLPEMFQQYVEHCQQRRIAIGKLWIYKPPQDAKEQRWVLNFPTKLHWKNPSKIEYLEAGLEKFVDTYQSRGIKSIAFPVLGSANGGLDERVSLSVMQEQLGRCDIPVEIYRYDPEARDDLYEEFRSAILSSPDDAALAKATGLQVHRARMIRDTLESNHRVNSLSSLASVKGIGLKTLEKCFRYVMDSYADDTTSQPRQAEFIVV